MSERTKRVIGALVARDLSEGAPRRVLGEAETDRLRAEKAADLLARARHAGFSELELEATATPLLFTDSDGSLWRREPSADPGGGRTHALDAFTISAGGPIWWRRSESPATVAELEAQLAERAQAEAEQEAARRAKIEARRQNLPQQVLSLTISGTPPGRQLTLREILRRIELAGAVVVVRQGGVRVHCDAPTENTIRLAEYVSRAAPALLRSVKRDGPVRPEDVPDEPVALSGVLV